MLLPAEYADSYCTGNSSNPAAKGSPYIDKTASEPTPESLISSVRVRVRARARVCVYFNTISSEVLHGQLTPER